MAHKSPSLCLTPIDLTLPEYVAFQSHGTPLHHPFDVQIVHEINHRDDVKEHGSGSPAAAAKCKAVRPPHGLILEFK